MNSSKLLIDESPLQLLPSLAEKVGLNEAVVLQQVHYLIVAGRTTPERDRKFDGWVYNTVAGWQEQYFKFWSTKTLQRAITSLEEKGLLISRQDRNYSNFYRMKWYAIDYKALNALIDEPETVAAEHDFTAPLPPQPKPCPPSDILPAPSDINNAPSDKLSQSSDILPAPSDINNAPSDKLSQSSDILSAPWDKLSRPSDKLSQSYTKITTEITTETTGREGLRAGARATPPAEPPPPADPPPEPPAQPVAKPPRFEPLSALLALGVDAQVAADWLAVRKAKRAALTQTALDGMVDEAHKAGISVAEAVRICAVRGWQGFKASWDWRDDKPQGRTFDGKPQGGQLSAGEQARQQALRIAEKMGLTPEQVGIYDANQ